jgi:UDP-N-acetylmuramoylalanine--D-glutamate ligase
MEMSMESWKQEFEGKKILIWGYGMEGHSSYVLIRKLLPDMQITIADGGPALQKAEKETENTFCISDKGIHTEDYDMVLKAPGIVVKEGTDTSNITGEAQLFLKHYRERTIGITGTKGKSTTTSLTYALLSEKYPTVLVGNIGRACFDAIDDMEKGALAAFEISCHQLEYCPYSPHVGVYLNLYEEHLDHYGTLQKYGNAKFNNIAHMQKGDTAIMNAELHDYIDRAPVKPVLIGKDIYAKGKTLHLPSGEIRIETCQLIGAHNYQNLAAAAYIAHLYGVSDEQIIHAASVFSPLPHRLQDLGVSNGIRYINDSISTIGQASILAMESIPDIGTILIGGMDRHISYDELERYLNERKDIKVIFMYASGHRVYEEMVQKGYKREGLFVTENLEEAVALAKKETKQGETCLLSPAASSYDHFRNFEERGREFERLAFNK